MKVLIVNSLYHPNVMGGAERSVRITAEALHAKGVEPVVVSTDITEHNGFVDGLKVYYLKIPNLYWMRVAKEKPGFLKPLWHAIDSYNGFASRKLRALIKQEAPDIVHTNNLTGISVAAWSAAAACHVPIIHTIRDYYLLCPRAQMYRRGHICERQCLDCRMFSWPRKRFSNRVKAVVGTSRYVLEKHLRLGCFHDTPIRRHIHNPVQPGEPLQRRETPTEVVTFGFVGLLAASKGVNLLLERFRTINPERARLLLFGRGYTQDSEEELRRRFESDRIRFMGYQPPEKVYSMVDVVISPSLLAESFGRTVPEANSYGRPVIVSNRGGLAEIVEDGRNGFVFDPDLPGDLDEKIRFFVDDPHLIDSMSDNCLEFARQFSSECIADQYIKLYEEVVP